MNPFEIFGLMVVGALVIYVLLGALVRLQACFLDRGLGAAKSSGATSRARHDRSDRRDDPETTSTPGRGERLEPRESR